MPKPKETFLRLNSLLRHIQRVLGRVLVRSCPFISHPLDLHLNTPISQHSCAHRVGGSGHGLVVATHTATGRGTIQPAAKPHFDYQTLLPASARSATSVLEGAAVDLSRERDYPRQRTVVPINRLGHLHGNK
jgi:hypothetical protein